MSRAHGCAVVACSLIILVVGYCLGIDRATRWADGHARTVPVTAIALVFGGLSMCHLRDRTPRGVATTNALAVMMLGVLAVQHYLWDLGSSSFEEWPSSVGPGQPSALTLAEFLLLGCALILRTRWMWVPMAAISASALAGHAVGSAALQGYVDQASGSMAIPTAAMFLACADGLRRVNGGDACCH